MYNNFLMFVMFMLLLKNYNKKKSKAKHSIIAVGKTSVILNNK